MSIDAVPFTLRMYAAADLGALVALDAVCFPPSIAFDHAAMRGFAEARGAVCVVSEAEGTLVGFAIAQVTGRRGYVVTLDVAAAFRRAGVASQLMQWVEDGAAAAGAGWMALHVGVGNAAAVRLYEGRGYGRGGVRRGFYGVGLDAFAYRKGLVRQGLKG